MEANQQDTAPYLGPCGENLAVAGSNTRLSCHSKKRHNSQGRKARKKKQVTPT